MSFGLWVIIGLILSSNSAILLSSTECFHISRRRIIRGHRLFDMVSSAIMCFKKTSSGNGCWCLFLHRNACAPYALITDSGRICVQCKIDLSAMKQVVVPELVDIRRSNFHWIMKATWTRRERPPITCGQIFSTSLDPTSLCCPSEKLGTHSIILFDIFRWFIFCRNRVWRNVVDKSGSVPGGHALRHWASRTLLGTNTRDVITFGVSDEVRIGDNTQSNSGKNFPYFSNK